MHMYNAILRSIIFPLIEMKSRTNQLRCWQSLEKSQWFNRVQIEHIQFEELKAILRHAYETVPFYRRRFKEARMKPEDIKNIQQLAKLPKLTKEEIRRNLPRMVSANIPRRKLVNYATGGSTGEPLQFFKDKRTISWAAASANRNYRWAGLDLGDKYISIWGSSFDISRSKKIAGFLRNLFERHRILSASGMSERSMAQYLEIIRKFKPKAIKGYASALVLLARYMNQEGISDLSVHSVISTAEKLFAPDRKRVEKQFNCKVFDTYGSREVAMIAGECQEHSGYHISAETVLVEFVKSNENVSEGELGEILITDLQNYGMPLIRYSIGDAGKPSDEVCSCGRGLPIMKSIEGRVTDFICTDVGRYISGPGLTLIFSDLSVKRYQILQRRIDQILVRIVTDIDYSDEDDRKIISRMKKIIGKNVEVVIEHVSSIPKSPRSGKHRFVISEVP